MKYTPVVAYLHDQAMYRLGTPEEVPPDPPNDGTTQV